MTSPRLWLRLAEYAADHASPGGMCFLQPGELRAALGVGSTSEVSRAIRRAVEAGWLDHRSSTRLLLVVPSKRRVVAR